MLLLFHAVPRWNYFVVETKKCTTAKMFGHALFYSVLKHFMIFYNKVLTGIN